MLRHTAIALLASLFLATPAVAAPIDLGADDDDAADEDDPLDLDLDDLDRGDTTSGDEDSSVLDEFDFEEPVEDFEILDDLPEDHLDDDPLPDFDILEDPVEDFNPPQRPHEPQGPGQISLDVAGKTPLADNYPLSVVAVDRDAVVVELPVLVARSRIEVEAGMLLYAEAWVGDQRITEVRQSIESPAAAEFGPTFTWFKILVPVVEHQGEVRVSLSKAALDGTGRAELFSRVTPYVLQ